MSPSRRSKSAEGSVSGPLPRTCSTGFTSCPCPAPAVLRTYSSGGGNHRIDPDVSIAQTNRRSIGSSHVHGTLGFVSEPANAPAGHTRLLPDDRNRVWGVATLFLL